MAGRVQSKNCMFLLVGKLILFTVMVGVAGFDFARLLQSKDTDVVSTLKLADLPKCTVVSE